MESRVSFNTDISSINDSSVNLDMEDFSADLVASDSDLYDDIFSLSDYDAFSFVFDLGNYGGNQENIKNVIMSYFSDMVGDINGKKAELVIDLIKEDYPDITDFELYNLINNFYKNACGYISMANILCTYFDSMNNGCEVFKDEFGYDLYYTDSEGIKHYNYEAIAIDAMLSKYKEDDLVNDDITFNCLTSDDFAWLFDYYLSSDARDFNAVVETVKIPISQSVNDEIINTMKDLSDESSFFCIWSNNFLLTNSDNETMIVSEGHEMTVTGITDNNNLDVSSWGEEFQFSFNEESIKDDSYVVLQKINILGGELYE